MKKEKLKKYTLNFEVPIIKKRKTKEGWSIPVRYNVKGMLIMIKRVMNTKEQQDLLDEYAKFYIMNELGIETYPLEK